MKKYIDAYIETYGMTDDLKRILELGKKEYSKIYGKKYYSEHKKETKRKERNERTEKILADYANGKRQVDIANELGVSRQYVFEVIKKEKKNSIDNSLQK